MFVRGEKLKLRVAPDPILREVCKPVERFDAGLEHLGTEMLRMLPKLKGIGLAAPQVGYAYRIVVVGFDGGLVFVNPEIEVLDWSPVVMQEGCLSLPGRRQSVERAKAVRVTAQDAGGNALTYEAWDFSAIVLQHEIDHLDGLLMTDRGRSGSSYS